MFYDYLKLFHIVSASLIIGSMVYSYHLWRQLSHTQDRFSILARIQKQTAFIIIPAALIQLGSGFTLITMGNFVPNQWVLISIVGFIILLMSWLSFVYFLAISENKLSDSKQKMDKNNPFSYKKIQTTMLLLCGLSIIIMIFSMANRFNGL